MAVVTKKDGTRMGIVYIFTVNKHLVSSAEMQHVKTGGIPSPKHYLVPTQHSTAKIKRHNSTNTWALRSLAAVEKYYLVNHEINNESL
ncbi:hypothetical protein [Kosakonia arachidis]|uniref:hypothetical protein n=1 Tax=Kosakonia arachidis TaxID=551989 RepID=UPI0011139AE0|nr:hypothetical protein [Kosakonia arachidis]